MELCVYTVPYTDSNVKVGPEGDRVIGDETNDDIFSEAHAPTTCEELKYKT
jgi:hypothetical protein